MEVAYQKEDLSQVNPQLYEWLAIVNGKSSNDIETQNVLNVNALYMQGGGKHPFTPTVDRKSTIQQMPTADEMHTEKGRTYKI